MRGPSREPAITAAARSMRELAHESRLHVVHETPVVGESSRTRPFRILAEQAEADLRVIAGAGDCAQALADREQPAVDTTALALETQVVINTYDVTRERYNQAAYRYARMTPQARERSRSWITEVRATYQRARDEYQRFMKALIRDAATFRAQQPQVAPPRVREPSTFEVFDRTERNEHGGPGKSHGVYDTLDEARGCVEFDRLTDYEIWQGDHIVEEEAGHARV